VTHRNGDAVPLDNRRSTGVRQYLQRSAIAPRGGVRNIKPTPPALRIFDAGMGDGTVLAGLMRATHRMHPTVPVLVVAKEISLEDVRLGLEKVPDRLIEHPATVVVITNLNYSEAPRLMPRSVHDAAALNAGSR
jgi:DNA-binding response OmpR family regulator